MKLGAYSTRHQGTPKKEVTPTRTSKRPRHKCRTLTEKVRPQKRPRASKGSEIYWEVMTDVKIPILKENYPEKKPTEDEKDPILKELGRVCCGTPKGKLPHLKVIQAGERHAHACVLINSLVNGITAPLTFTGRGKEFHDRTLPKPVKAASDP
jgi:hypothetical protein